MVADAATELARLAGAEIESTLQREITVEYKDEPKGDRAPSNPVSEVDHAVEDLVRDRLAERFPTHQILAEEQEFHPDADAEWVWSIDPVDGTTNFINGFPLFAASIGVLHYGRVVASAVWCSTGHELRPGVYHAVHGGALEFEGRPVSPGRPSSGVSRRLIAVPGGAAGRMHSYDTRTTGSAAIECAFVAAGIFGSATFWAPSAWDVAGGVGLVRAAGGEVLTREGGVWVPFERFVAPSELPRRSAGRGASEEEPREPSLRDWRGPLLMGTPEALEALQRSFRTPSWWGRLWRRLGGS